MPNRGRGEGSPESCLCGKGFVEKTTGSKGVPKAKDKRLSLFSATTPFTLCKKCRHDKDILLVAWLRRLKEIISLPPRSQSRRLGEGPCYRHAPSAHHNGSVTPRSGFMDDGTCTGAFSRDYFSDYPFRIETRVYQVCPINLK